MKMTVGFDDLEIECVIGDQPYERTKEQMIFVDLRVIVDVLDGNDSIASTVDYTALASCCRKVASEGKFQMLETLAAHLKNTLLKEFPIKSLTIRIKKPEALMKAKWAILELK